MPRYEYQCSKGHKLEQVFAYGEAPSEVPCPTCIKLPAKRLFTSVGFTFKGGKPSAS